jgi:ABC-type uncharacterized transport system ATPase subunit
MATSPRSCREGEAVSDHEGQLELTELRRRFGDTIALDGLSFTVPRGQVFGFLGPNGAGMTTAMRAIVGVAALDSGWRSTWWSGKCSDRLPDRSGRHELWQERRSPRR